MLRRGLSLSIASTIVICAIAAADCYTRAQPAICLFVIFLLDNPQTNSDEWRTSPRHGFHLDVFTEILAALLKN